MGHYDDVRERYDEERRAKRAEELDVLRREVIRGLMDIEFNLGSSRYTLSKENFEHLRMKIVELRGLVNELVQ